MANNRNIKHSRIIEAILSDIDPTRDAPIQEIAVGARLAALRSAGSGLASLMHSQGGPAPGDPKPAEFSRSTLSLALSLPDPPEGLAQARTLAVAAINSLLAPPDKASDIKGQNLLAERAEGGNVAVIGHFPFVERMSDKFSSFTVLELRPRPGDTPAEKAAEVLPKADAVAVTSTSIINGTLGGILSLIRPGAFVMLLGPSTPYAPSLFDFGVDALAGSVIDDPELALSGVRAGLAFRDLAGVRPLTVLA